MILISAGRSVESHSSDFMLDGLCPLPMKSHQIGCYRTANHLNYGSAIEIIPTCDQIKPALTECRWRDIILIYYIIFLISACRKAWMVSSVISCQKVPTRY